MRRLGVAAFCALLLVPAAAAAPSSKLTQQRATAIFLANPKVARCYHGAFGGKEINSLPIWLGFCAAFLIGLADFRRPLSLRNLDLLALVSFSVSLWYFNKGHVFTAMPLVYPPLVYLLGRMV